MEFNNNSSMRVVRSVPSYPFTRALSVKGLMGIIFMGHYEFLVCKTHVSVRAIYFYACAIYWYLQYWDGPKCNKFNQLM